MGCIYMELFPSFKVCYFNIFPVSKRETQNDLITTNDDKFYFHVRWANNQKFIVVLFHSYSHQDKQALLKSLFNSFDKNRN